MYTLVASEDTRPMQNQDAQTFTGNAKDTGVSTISNKPNEARAAVRKNLSGRVKLTFDNQAVIHGRVIDMSTNGSCVLFDSLIKTKTPCMLEFKIFHNGSLCCLNVAAIAVYSILGVGNGFKVGLQFGPQDKLTTQTIKMLLK